MWIKEDSDKHIRERGKKRERKADGKRTARQPKGV